MIIRNSKSRVILNAMKNLVLGNHFLVYQYCSGSCFECCTKSNANRLMASISRVHTRCFTAFNMTKNIYTILKAIESG